MPDASTAAPVTAGAPADPLDVALRIARRLAPVDDVVRAVRGDSLVSRSWNDHGTASGFAGLALLFGCLDRCREGEGWDRSAHEHLSVAVEAAQQVPYLPPGLSSGTAGLGFVALCLARGDQRYRRLRRTLDTRLAEYVAAWIEGPEPGDGRRSRRALDVITGAAGIAAYLVCRPETDALSSLRGPLLTWLAAHIIDGRLPLRPGSDAADCGLAHGLPGPVSALALARLRGITVPGTETALRTGTAWILDRRVADRWGTNWPMDDSGSVPPRAAGSVPQGATGSPPPRTAGSVPPRTPGDEPPTHAAWCYGAPGVARSLLLTGRALGDPAMVRTALNAVEAIRRRPDRQRRLVAPTFCHGEAGLAHLFHRTAVETGIGGFAAEADRLHRRLAGSFDPSARFGYRAVQVRGALTDSPGLLDGAAGVAAVLLSAAVDDPPDWDRLFLVR
ncbi:lanthionine synthetase C family protein [Streptomyces sp. NPDC079020]|uniref:lanthionine synthetase C family protein n=1 Tax=Streptomyces sp. NPDC079020 TaxID=3365722 RepID=UPI0037D4851F